MKKCPYCDFNSHEKTGELPQTAYIDALLEDLDLDLRYTQDRVLDSIFIGGGTPSLLYPEHLEKLLLGVRSRIAFADDCEITMEANPGTVEAGRFVEFRQAGINRLSLGIQSFDDIQLKTLGRIHDAAQARRAIAIAQGAGFSNLNLDLMYGLPGQTGAAAVADLQQALEFKTPHLSWYQLTIEPNTRFFSSPPELPDEDHIMEIQELGLALLDSSGFQRYEISAYSRDASRSRHNLNYWQFGDYLGIGAGAHGKISLADDGVVLRTRKFRQPEHYLQQQSLNYTAEHRFIDPAELPLEYMLNALRLVDGFTVAGYESRTGLAFSDIQKKIECLRDAGFLAFFNNSGDGIPQRIAPTSKGLLFTNSLLEEFL